MIQSFYRSTAAKRLWHAVVVVLVIAMFSVAAPDAPSLHPESVALAAGTSVIVPAPWRVHQALLEVKQVTSAAPAVSATRVVSSPAVASSPAVVSTVSMTGNYEPVPSATADHVISLIKAIFPPSAWHDAEVVAWCESKFNPTDIGFDSNGTHDRGVFQLNDGGTEQYLLGRLGLDPNNLALAFNPVLNIRAAAVLYARDGWSQWSCQSALP